MKKNMLGMVFIILALMFVIIGLVGSWYSTHMKMSTMGMMEMDVDISLTKIYSTSNMNGQKVTQSMNISAIREQYDVSGMNTGFLDAIGNTFIITIVALIFAILAMVFVILSLFKPKIQMIGGFFSILLFVFMLIAPIIFMIGFTGYAETQSASFGASGETSQIGFWFSTSQGGNETSMGPGYAWYLMIVGAVFGLIAAILIFIKNKQPVSEVMTQPQNPVTPVQ